MGCTGECCASFYLTKKAQLEIMNGVNADSQTTRVMLIPLGKGHFTCRNWDPKSKLCGIYESRPQMCVDFPVKGNPCGAKGCTL